MRSAFAMGVAFLFLDVSDASAQVIGWAPCPMPCYIAYEMRPVVCYRPEWREEKVPCVVQRVSYRKEVTPLKTQVWTLKQFDEWVRTSYYVPLPREVERECSVSPQMAHSLK
ncbi:MAG: hypothetical protein EXR98_11180 [Gemmataceae bacterium]|nr:hypothetical protein [Gemmataceae bacterium]